MSVRTVTLGAVAKITSGGTPERTRPAYWNGTIPWIKTAQIQNCTINAELVDEWITQEGLEQSSARMIPEGTILMAMYGQGKTRGQVAILGIDATINQACAAILLKPEANRDYVYQQLRYRYESIRALSNTGSQENLNAELIREIAFPLPALEEQEAIAQALVVWDAAIQKAEQLIAAKERLTRALMRRVFEPTNYPCVRISEFARRITRKNTEGNGHPLTISGAEGLVSQSRYFGKRIAAEHTEHYTLLKHGEFAYNKSYSAGYPLGAIKRLDAHDEGIVSTLYLCFALEEGKAPISDYFAYFCEAGGFNRQIYQVAQEGARNHGLLNVTAEDFFSMRMPFPPSEVQERVVRTLTSAMRELTLLRDQLVALRAQKRGLMQKLLTGQWRLPVQVEAN
jgi:type I restriction enzyme S subunit